MIIWPAQCAKFCAAIGAKRRCGSSHSPRIGGLPQNSVPPGEGHEKAASKAKAAISGATAFGWRPPSGPECGTATGLINELAETAHANQLSRALARWERLDLICIDELGYVPLAETACELMFQVIAGRAEKAAAI